jgi:hypothetical protein
VDGVGTGPARELDDPLGGEVGLGSRAASQRVRLVRIRDVRRAAVCVRVDGDRSDAELAQRPEDADRDLAAVRDQNLGERHGRILSSK